MNDLTYDLYMATNKEKPKAEDVKKLRQHLAEHPGDSAMLGNLSSQVEIQILQVAFKQSKAGEISTSEYMKQMRMALGLKQATPLERSLIEHVVLCWLRLHVTELRYDGNTSNMSLAMADYWECKLSTHQARYLKAVETLARVRKLNINIQVNIGDKQVITG